MGSQNGVFVHHCPTVHNSSEIQMGRLAFFFGGWVSKPGNNPSRPSTLPSEFQFCLLNQSSFFQDSSVYLQMSGFFQPAFVLAVELRLHPTASFHFIFFLLVQPGSVYAETIFSGTLGFMWISQGFTTLDRSYTCEFLFFFFFSK